jgi:hypothetical protein
LAGVGSAAWQGGRTPERAPADAHQSLNRRRAKSPHTAPAERPRRCIMTRHTFNLSAVIGESAAIPTQGHGSGLHTLDPCQLLRRLFAFRFWRSFGRPRPPPVLPIGTPPGTDSNSNPLGPQPLPGGPDPERGAPPDPRAHPAVDKNQGIRDLVFGALTEVTAGGSSAPISWWDGANHQAAPGRPHGGGSILSTCTFLRLGGRARTATPKSVFDLRSVIAKVRFSAPPD